MSPYLLRWQWVGKDKHDWQFRTNIIFSVNKYSWTSQMWTLNIQNHRYPDRFRQKPILSLYFFSHIQKAICQYSALLLHRGLFSPNNSWETPIARPFGQGMGVFHEILVWLKFCLWNLVHCLWYHVIWYHDISRVYSIWTIILGTKWPIHLQKILQKYGTPAMISSLMIVFSFIHL